MESESRTSKGIKNSVVSVAFVAVQSLLGFFSRKIFIDCLGAEVLGLNTTATNILEILNLAELGIGGAVAFSLYKPLHNKDHDRICDIVSLQGHFYRLIAWGLTGISIVIMAAFPWIFSKMTLPLWYAYASFGALLFSALLGYFVNYRQIVLTAAQMDYKIRYSQTSWILVKLVLQMAAVKYMPHPYMAWVVLEFLFAFIAAYSLRRATDRTFPYLKESPKKFKTLREEYNIILTKVKQIFVHRLTGVATQQTSPLIIYAYISLKMVAVYGNYLILFTSITRLCGTAFTSTSAGVGDLVAEGDNERVQKVFKELFTLRFLISSLIIYTALTACQDFVTLWMGADYLLPYSTLVIICCTFFITMQRTAVDMFLNAYGLFQDVWAAIAEAIINIGLSLLLGYYWGLNGIISGVMISLILLIAIWKPYFLFTCGFRMPARKYFAFFLLLASIAFASGAISAWAVSLIPFNPADSWILLFIYAGAGCLLYTTLFTVGAYMLDTGMKQFVQRLKSHFQKH